MGVNHDFWNWMAVLWLAGAVGYLSVVPWTMDGDAQRSCSRRGCRRMPAGKGCDHRACDGSRARIFHEED